MIIYIDLLLGIRFSGVIVIGAIDIGGSKIAVAVVTQSGQILSRAECATAPTDGPQKALSRIVELLRGCERQVQQSVRGIGVGCTGPVYPRTGTVGKVDLLPGWEGLGITERLSQEFGVESALENDADAAALAEARWGAGEGVDKFVYITVSTGIGGGLIIDGQLYRGAGGSHPEFGHHTIDSQGPICYCGSRGCWESLASGPALAEWVRQNAGPGDQIRAGLSAYDVCLRARKGDDLALRAVDREGTYLGLGLANLVTIFCPNAIALGGGVMASADLFLDRAREVIRTHCGLVPHENTSVELASLGKDTPLLGAACVWKHRFHESGERNTC